MSKDTGNEQDPNRLWILGDSFASDDCPVELPGLNDQWHRVLASVLGTETVNLAVSGTSLDFTYWTWDRAQSKIKPGDTVIVSITEPSRRWLIRDRPSFSTAARVFGGEYAGMISSELIQAMHAYFRYLYHPGAEKAHLQNWLCSLDRWAQSGSKILLLAAFPESEKLLRQLHGRFPNISFAVGDLVSVSLGECHSSMRSSILENEFRINHLSFSNHAILANKIKAWYLHNEVVDLTSGFEKNFIDRMPL